MADKKPVVNYSGKLKEIASGDKIPIASLATGTPDGTKFIRDDGVLATPSGSGGGGITYTEVTGTSQSMTGDNGYIANNASLVTFTLPSTCAVGKILHVIGYGAGGWKIAQNASQNIYFLDVVSLTGTSGYIASNTAKDSVKLICTVANTTFTVVNSIGNITINIS